MFGFWSFVYVISCLPASWIISKVRIGYKIGSRTLDMAVDRLKH